MQLIIIEKIYHPESVFCLSINSIEGFQNRNECVFLRLLIWKECISWWTKKVWSKKDQMCFLQQWDQEVLNNSILFLSPWFFWGVGWELVRYDPCSNENVWVEILKFWYNLMVHSFITNYSFVVNTNIEYKMVINGYFYMNQKGYTKQLRPA